MRCTTSDLSLSVATFDSGVRDEISPVNVAVLEMSARNRIVLARDKGPVARSLLVGAECEVLR